MDVFSFDRDGTIDVNPIDADHPSVPLAWIQYLVHHTDHEVWVHGNQRLCRETGAAGKRDALAHYERTWGDPLVHVEDRPHTRLEVQREGLPDPDIITAMAALKRSGRGLEKHQQLRLVQTLFPAADRFVCVDNRYFGFVEGWTSYLPADFLDAFSDIQTALDQLDDDVGFEPPPQPPERRSVRLVSKGSALVPPIISRQLQLRRDKRIPIRRK